MTTTTTKMAREDWKTTWQILWVLFCVNSTTFQYELCHSKRVSFAWTIFHGAEIKGNINIMFYDEAHLSFPLNPPQKTHHLPSCGTASMMGCNVWRQTKMMTATTTTLTITTGPLNGVWKNADMGAELWHRNGNAVFFSAKKQQKCQGTDK